MEQMNLDINVVGAFALVLTGFGIFVRLTIKSAIADLKDALAKIYMSAAEVTARFSALHSRVDAVEKLVADHIREKH
jgi:prefoldin subunit 5